MSVFLGLGHTAHQRFGESSNRFSYPMYFIQFRTDQESILQDELKKKSLGCWSFSAQDYLQKQDGSLDVSIRKFLSDQCGYNAEEIWLSTMPRMFGYVFNPVSFWFCYRAGRLNAVLSEVNNTFGERHFYWISAKEGEELKDWESRAKEFHVSPFLPVSGYYKFLFRRSSDAMRVDINYYNVGGKLELSTWVEGKLSSFSGHSFSSLFLRYGWITALVLFRIHYQALRLWLKGSHFFRKPKLPEQEITHE